MPTPREQLIEKLGRLPLDRLEEVEDFVDFLSLREIERELSRAATAASEPAFATAWDNSDDDVYNDL